MKYIAYTRVSTKQQGIGLDAQMAIIGKWIDDNGGGTIIASMSEKESGKDTIHRPVLQQAIDACKGAGATLIVAKLDRLSRDVADIFALKKIKGLNIVVCDMDASDTMMLGIFATLAQKERELISRRTREALQALKAQGRQLGNPNAAEVMKANNAKGRARKTDDARNCAENKHAYMAVRLMQGTLQSKADFLNENGFKTRNGKAFAPMSVKRLIALFERP